MPKTFQFPRYSRSCCCQAAGAPYYVPSYIRQVCSTLATPQSPRWSWGCCCRAAAAQTCVCLSWSCRARQGSAWLTPAYQVRHYLTPHNLAFHRLGGLGHGDSILSLLLDLITASFPQNTFCLMSLHTWTCTKVSNLLSLCLQGTKAKIWKNTGKMKVSIILRY